MSEQMTVGFPTFVLMADEFFLDWLELALESLSRSNPNANVLLYDLSVNSGENRLTAFAKNYSAVTVVPWPESRWKWPDWVEETTFDFFWPQFTLSDELKYITRKIRYTVTGKKKSSWLISKEDFLQGKRRFIRINSQKPFVFLDALDRCGGAIAYVDADAIVLNRFSSVPVDGVDIAITVVDKDLIRIGVDLGCGNKSVLPWQTVNAGVIFLNNTPLCLSFINEWINELWVLPHTSSEQTALANLIYKNNPNAFDGDFSEVVSKDGLVKVRVLPCRIYNYFRINLREAAPRDAAIVHFIGGVKQKERRDEVVNFVRSEWARRDLRTMANFDNE